MANKMKSPLHRTSLVSIVAYTSPALLLLGCATRFQSQTNVKQNEEIVSRLLDSDTQCPATRKSSAQLEGYKKKVFELAESQKVDANRQNQLAKLQPSVDSKNASFDVVVIGGGATGLAACLQSAKQGLKVACVDKGDFASGTSSRSTKLIHGGVRYLQNAIVSTDLLGPRKENIGLVTEGLRERARFLKMAPHLTSELRIMTPVYATNDFTKFVKTEYLATGLKVYDKMSQENALQLTKSFSAKDKSFAGRYPMFRKDAKRTDRLFQHSIGGVVEYSDGQFNDARMAVSVAMTALKEGATVVNHMELTSFVKENGRITGVNLEDKLKGTKHTLNAKVVINATGPGLDVVRLKLDDESEGAMVVGKPGTHIVVSAEKMPIGDKGVLISKAENGSVGFFKPFENNVLIGTTEEDLPKDANNPNTTENHVSYLIKMANNILPDDKQITRADVKSVWTGIRPLVSKPQVQTDGKKDVDTSASRLHLVVTSKSGLVSIGGGKWTSFGEMGREVVAKAIASANLESKADATKDLAQDPVIGGIEFHTDLCTIVKENLQQSIADQVDLKLDPAKIEQIAVSLSRSYGTKVPLVLDLIRGQPELVKPISEGSQYIRAEAVYAAEQEMAQTPSDVLARRTRLAFIDHKAAVDAVSEVSKLMATASVFEKANLNQEKVNKLATEELTGMAPR